ncbi:hypothetical protein [Arachidicoccus sp.]|uniref:hypothetical protein n=1 Tax=Arachidicoccus sp. TaxID=1872624 RepID=UPI003D21D004
MTLKHAKELDDLLNKALNVDWIGNGALAGIARSEQERRVYIRDHDLCAYIARDFGYLDPSTDRTIFRLNGLGRIIMDLNNNKPFEELFYKEERAKELLIIEKERLEDDRKFEREFKEKSLRASIISPLVAAIVGGIIGSVLAFILSRLNH